MNKVRLNGCQIHKIKFDSNGEPESAVIKFGELLYMPLDAHDIWRLEVHDTGIKLMEEFTDTHKNYTLDVEGMDLDKVYDDFSQLIGVDYRSKFTTMFFNHDQDFKDKVYKETKEQSRIQEW